MKAKKSIPAIVLLLSIIFIVPESHAQFYKDMSVGLNGGAYVYQGDLNPERLGSFKTIQPGFSIFAKKPINHFLAVRLHMSFARLKGDESRYNKPEYRQRRNFSFTTPVKEFSGQLVWNIRGRNYDDHGIMPYLFSGAGVSLVRIQKDYSRMDPAFFEESPDIYSNLAVDNAHGTPRAIFSVPVGAGAEYPLSDRFSVNAEAGYRFIFTDYLDGFSKSVSPKYQDHYYSGSAGIIYKFGVNGKGVGCPVVKF